MKICKFLLFILHFQKDEILKLYSFYCQNVIKSDKLRHKVGERNEFFLSCQMKLGHKLPLAAYMLKPVQRITKYQLLLKVNWLEFNTLICKKNFVILVKKYENNMESFRFFN